MKQFLHFSLFVLLTTLLACHKNNDTPSNPAPSGKTVQAAVTASLSGVDSFSSYLTAFNTITLSDADVAKGITIFVPSNKAFNAAIASIRNAPGRNIQVTGNGPRIPGVTGLAMPDSSDPKDYIVPGNITSAALTNGATFTALSGNPLTVTSANGALYLNGILISGMNIAYGTNYYLYSLAGLFKTSKLRKITGLSDSTTFPGWLMTIYGQNFDTVVANTTVNINGISAIVHSVSATQIVITVPQTSGTAIVSVTNKGVPLMNKWPLRIMQANVGTIAQTVANHVSGVQGLTFDPNGNLYFTNDNYNGLLFNCVGKLNTAGNLIFFQPRFPNPNLDGTFLSTVYNSLFAIAVDGQNNVYFQSTGGSAAAMYTGIYQFNIVDQAHAAWWAGTTNTIHPVTGDKRSVAMNGLSMKFDANGNLLTGDWAGLRSIAPNGSVRMVADSTKFLIADPTVRKNPALYGLDIDGNGNIYASDGYQGNSRVWKIGTDGSITCIAGNTNSIAKDGIGSSAQFGSPFGLVLDKRGNIYVSDNDYMHSSFLIRMINPKGVVTTIAGQPNPNYTSTDGVGTNATFNGANALAIDSKGVLYVGPDQGGIRTITIQ